MCYTILCIVLCITNGDFRVFRITQRISVMHERKYWQLYDCQQFDSSEKRNQTRAFHPLRINMLRTIIPL